MNVQSPSSSIHEAAEAIAGDNRPPDWLIRDIGQLTEMVLGRLRQVDERRPGRKDWREQLDATKQSAELIKKKLFGYERKSPKISDQKQYLLYEMLLVDEDCGRLDFADGDFLRKLDALISRCQMKLDAMPKTQGGGKPDIGITGAPLPAKTVCALMVGVLWEGVHGRFPGVNNQSAHAACAALWQAASDSGEDDPAEDGWRAALEKARTLAKSSWQAEMLRRLIEGCREKA